NEAIPQVLASDPKKLAEINAEIDKIKVKTGIDLRQFDEIAIGLKSESNGNKMNLDALVLARGKQDSQDLIANAKLLAKTHREEKINGTTVYVFSTKELKQDNKNGNAVAKLLGTLGNNLPTEIAVCALEKKTIAFGSVKAVREALTSTPKLKAEIASLLNQKPNAIIRFGAEIPSDLPILQNLGDEEIEKTLSSIQHLFGWIDSTEKGIQISVNAKTKSPDNAQALEEMLDTLRMLAGSFLGGLSGKDKKVYAKMINDVKISRNESLVSLNLEVLKDDLKTLIY
ncbi:MAG: hypothetical protein ACK419_05340, partial [Pyrinomonadaceae bacterium]